MEGDGHGAIAGAVAEVQVQGFGELVDGGFGGAVGVPAAEGVVGDGADAGGHEGEGGGSGEGGVGSGVGGGRGGGGREEGGGGFAGKKGAEVFEEEEGAEGVGLKGAEGVGVGDLGGGFFGVEDAGDAEGEMEVGVLGRGKFGGAVGGGGGDGGFVWSVGRNVSGWSIFCWKGGERKRGRGGGS